MSYTEKIAEQRLGAGHIQSLFLMPVALLLAQRQLSDKNYEFTAAQIPPLKMEKGKERDCRASCKSKAQTLQLRDKGSDTDLSHAFMLLNLDDSDILYV